MKKKKALRKAFKIIAAVLILAVICVGTFLAYTWFCEPPCPDEVYYRNSVYIRAKSVDGCGAYLVEKNDIKQMFNKDETLSSVTDEEAENVDVLVCESNDYFIFIKPKIGTNYEMYCKKDIDYNAPVSAEKILSAEIIDDKGNAVYSLDKSAFNTIVKYCGGANPSNGISSDEESEQTYRLAAYIEDIPFPKLLGDVIKTDSNTFGFRGYGQPELYDYCDITTFIK